MITITNHGGVLSLEGVPPLIKSAICKGLQLKNLTYIRLMRMGNYRNAQWAGEFVKYFHEDKKGILWIGRGNLERVCKYLENTHNAFKCVDKTVLPPISTPFTIDATLRDYQVPIWEKFKDVNQSNGLIVLGTGWGKTLFAIHIAQYLKTKTLIVVPRGHLLAQFQQDILNFTGEVAGTIQAKNFDVRDITIGTIETVKKHKDKIANEFGLVIFDEAHLVVTKKAIALIQALHPKYLFGMTGSPMRSDQQHGALKWIFGEYIVEDYLPHAPPAIHVYHSNVHIPVRDYPSIVEEQVLNEERNKLIAGITIELIGVGRTVLVLTKRVTHTQTLESLLPNCGIIPVYAQTPQKIKAELLDKLRTNKMEYSGLLGTAALIGTGLDISKIDSVLIACDIKSKALLIQCIGRSLRLLKGKPNPLIVDIHDNQNIVLHRQYLERAKYYKEQGYIILEKNIKQNSLW